MARKVLAIGSIGKDLASTIKLSWSASSIVARAEQGARELLQLAMFRAIG